ncbi:MAG: 16S rRNA processing protein RimM [Bacilli bacterium]|nr:16S rRNA processing protein RimM [Bacilli bacterium]
MIVVGHITTTHGIKGELKCYTDFSRQDLVFHENQKVYINGKEHILTSLRTHKNHYLITLDDLRNINLVEDFRNQDITVKREDLKLEKEEYLIEELETCSVYEDEIYLGEIKEIRYNKSGYLLSVKKDKTFYIPFQDYFIKKVNLEEKKVTVQNTKGLW